jgi:hypothetical protein
VSLLISRTPPLGGRAHVRPGRRWTRPVVPGPVVSRKTSPGQGGSGPRRPHRLRPAKPRPLARPAAAAGHRLDTLPKNRRPRRRRNVSAQVRSCLAGRETVAYAGRAAPYPPACRTRAPRWFRGPSPVTLLTTKVRQDEPDRAKRAPDSSKTRERHILDDRVRAGNGCLSRRGKCRPSTSELATRLVIPAPGTTRAQCSGNTAPATLPDAGRGIGDVASEVYAVRRWVTETSRGTLMSGTSPGSGRGSRPANLGRPRPRFLLTQSPTTAEFMREQQ